MCGIAGFSKKDAEWEKDIRCMLRTMQRRGPDGEGLWTSPNDEIVLGHRRLSILDLSKNGSQPMVSLNERYVISFNGEIYNYEYLKQKINNCVVTKFRSSSDTEVLLEGFEVLGVEKTLKIIKGMFAIALYDRKEKKLYLIRDRFGEKPLYYGFLQKQFMFASDLCAIKAIRDAKLEINLQALDDYFKYGYISGEMTIYEGIFSVMPGNIIEIDMKQKKVVRKEKYWNYAEFAEEKFKTKESLEDAQEHLEDLMKKAIQQQLVTTDVPIGAFLSGGIDSSLIVALGQIVSNGKLNTYSVGFYDEKYNEAHYAKKVSELLGTTHHELYVTEEEAKKEVIKIAEAFSEPFADVSEIPTLLVSKMAKKDVTVALSGDGGDELFGGYTRYLKDVKYWNVSKYIPSFSKKAIENFINVGIIRDERIAKRLRIISSVSPTQLYEKAQWPSVLTNKLLDCRKQVDEWSIKEDLKLQDAFMFRDIEHYLPSDILVKVDRAGMYYSLESRMPFLDRDVAEYAASLPLDYKIQSDKGKIILKNILKKYCPKELIERKKKGFSLPIEKWVLNDKNLNDWANELLDEKKIEKQGIIDSTIVNEYWKNYKEGKNSFHFIWRILMFENWYEHCYLR